VREKKKKARRRGFLKKKGRGGVSTSSARRTAKRKEWGKQSETKSRYLGEKRMVWGGGEPRNQSGWVFGVSIYLKKVGGRKRGVKEK